MTQVERMTLIVRLIVRLNSMLKSGFCDYNDTYIPVCQTVEIPNTETAAAKNNIKI